MMSHLPPKMRLLILQDVAVMLNEIRNFIQTSYLAPLCMPRHCYGMETANRVIGLSSSRAEGLNTIKKHAKMS